MSKVVSVIKCRYCKSLFDPTVYKNCPLCESIAYTPYVLDKVFIQLMRSNKPIGVKGMACREILRNSNLTPHDLTINIRVWSRRYFCDTVWIKTKSGKRQIEEKDIRRYCNTLAWTEPYWLQELDRIFGKNGIKPNPFIIRTLKNLRLIVNNTDRFSLSQIPRLLIHIPKRKASFRSLGYSLSRYFVRTKPLKKPKHPSQLHSFNPKKLMKALKRKRRRKKAP